MESVARHRCMIYEGSPARHLPWIVTQIAEQLSLNRRCIYLNSPQMVADLAIALRADGIDVMSEIRRGRLVFSSDQTHLTDGRFDTARMIQGLRSLVAAAGRDGYPGVWIAGDMSWEFGDHINFRELIAYERALEDAFQSLPTLNGVCLYHRDTLPDHAIPDALCTHKAVHFNETLFRLNPFFTPEHQPRRADIPSDLRDLLERFRLNT